ncbi:MAG: pilus assembly PilX N-terminal domain-containing protein [Actinomycetota bacterium]|nr:pilus assembly PilX N-terminal domain-containing protein [Actinomycetota bacterium]
MKMMRLRREKGMAMVTAIMLVLAFAVLGGAAIIATTGDVRMSKNLEDSNQALAIAEAGANYATVNLKANWDFFSIANPADTIDDSKNFPNPADSNAKFELRVTAPATNTRVINSTGIGGDAKRIVEVKLSRINMGYAFSQVLLANLNIGFRGTLPKTVMTTTGKARLNDFNIVGKEIDTELRVTSATTGSPLPQVSFAGGPVTYGPGELVTTDWTAPSIFSESESNILIPFLTWDKEKGGWDYFVSKDYSNTDPWRSTTPTPAVYFFYSDPAGKGDDGSEWDKWDVVGAASVEFKVKGNVATAYPDGIVNYQVNKGPSQTLNKGGLQLPENAIIVVRTVNPASSTREITGYAQVSGDGAFKHTLISDGRIEIIDDGAPNNLLFDPSPIRLALAAPIIEVTANSANTSRSIRFGESGKGVLVYASSEFSALPSANGGRIQMDLYGSLLSFGSIGLGQNAVSGIPSGNNGLHLFSLESDVSYVNNLYSMFNTSGDKIFQLFKGPKGTDGDDDQPGWTRRWTDYIKFGEFSNNFSAYEDIDFSGDVIVVNSWKDIR